LKKQLGVAASLIAAALVLTGCAQIGGVLRSEAWNAGHSFGSNLSSSSYMEAFAGCQFAQPQVFPTSSESAYNDFMDGCTTAALSDSGASTSDGNEFESGSDSGQSALGEYPQEGQQYETSAVNLMREEVSFLDSQSSANWTFSKSGDPFGTAIGIVFDDYGGDGGCAIWWYESESDAQLAILNGKVNFFSEFYGQWTYTSGPSMILVAESASHPCYIDATRILKLEGSNHQDDLEFDPDQAVENTDDLVTEYTLEDEKQDKQNLLDEWLSNVTLSSEANFREDTGLLNPCPEDYCGFMEELVATFPSFPAELGNNCTAGVRIAEEGSGRNMNLWGEPIRGFGTLSRGLESLNGRVYVQGVPKPGVVLTSNQFRVSCNTAIGILEGKITFETILTSG
jgi:hypothetical protein